MTEPASSSDPFALSGTTIEGKYRIASVIGDGGFGVVYRGVHKGFGELIAVKCLKVPQALDEAARDQFLEQLREEGRILHRLSRVTPGIVQALDVGAFTTERGVWVPYLVLEWLDGETLAEHLKRREHEGKGPYTVAEAIELLEPAARALATAHAQKIAHRDVKPPNLFVTTVAGKPTIKVLDFGIAKVLTEHPSFTEALAATKVGPTAFTPRYGAPEQFNKQRGASGPWTDVFALALIFVELITGKKALDGDDPTQLYIASADPGLRPTARSRGAEVPDLVERVIEKALSVEPKNRYADAGDLWGALTAAARGEPLPPPRATLLSPSTPTPTVNDPRAADASLSTVEFVSQAEAAKSAPRKGGLEHQATVPAESLSNAPDSPPAIVSNRAKGDPTRADGTLPRTNQGTARTSLDRTDDPMAETPLILRAATEQSVKGGGVHGATAKSPSVDPPKKKGGAGKWIALALIGGAGLGVAYLKSIGQPTLGPSTHPTASASASAHAPKPVASASPSAVSSAPALTSAMPSASASPAEPPEGMIAIAPGALRMGEGQDAREVKVTHAFFLDRHEVTANEYLTCVKAHHCSAADRVTLPPELGDAGSPEFVDSWSARCNARTGDGDHPINCVDWVSAAEYCRFKSKRLPTEAEWELAARGLDGRPYPWGGTAPTCQRACYDKNGGSCAIRGESIHTCKVGAQADKTPEGLLDMAGNVAEWVSDGFVSPAPGGNDPIGADTSGLKVVRGGSFLDGEDRLKLTYRAGVSPSTAYVAVGFRCAAAP
jgi:serine/threonine-protein kinase